MIGLIMHCPFFGQHFFQLEASAEIRTRFAGENHFPPLCRELTCFLPRFSRFDALGFDPGEVESCPAKCVFVKIPSVTPPQGCLDMADLLLVTANGTPPPQATKPPHQAWGYFSLESASLYPEMDSPSYMSQFDMEISTRSPPLVAKAFPHLQHIQATFAPREAMIVKRQSPDGKIAGALYLQGR